MARPAETLARLGLAAFAVVALAAAAAAESIHDRVTTFTLDNGLQVVVVPDHRAPVVTHTIYYKAGAIDEPRGKSGIAHFLEHLMFKGTTSFPDGGFSERVSAIGGNDNAFTSSDMTAYHQTVASRHLGLMMEFEADRMANLVITEDGVVPEREVILEERRSRTDNNPRAQLGEAISASLYLNHPYRLPIIGWEHEVKGLTREDALAFYDTYYAPNNAVVVVAGDVTEEEVRVLAEETYGRIPARASVPERNILQEPPQLAARTVTLADPRVAQPSVSRYYLVPSYTTAEPGEAEAFDLLANILGGGTTSRLYTDLVVDSGRAVGAGAYYAGSRFGPTSFVVYASPRGGLTNADMTDDIDAQIARVLEDGVTEEELAAAKRRVRASTIFAEDSVARIGRSYGSAVTNGRTIEDVRAWPERIAAVTVADINAVARKYLDIERSVTGYLEPESSEPS